MSVIGRFPISGYFADIIEAMVFLQLASNSIIRSRLSRSPDDPSTQQGIQPFLPVLASRVTARPNGSLDRSPQTLRQALGLCPSASPTYCPSAEILSTSQGTKSFCLVSTWQTMLQPPISLSWHQLQLAGCHKAAVSPSFLCALV